MRLRQTIRMNTLTLGAVVAVALVSAANVLAQDAPGPPPTVASITAAIGSDADARDVFSIVFTHMFQPSYQATKFLLSSQVRPGWLPAIDRVDFVLLTDAEAATLISNCGTYWRVSRVEHSDKVVSLRFDERCGGTRLEYVVSFDGHAWRLGPPGTGQNGGGWSPGIGSGFSGPPPDCPCFQRGVS